MVRTPLYMIQASYTAEAWEAMCDDPAMCMPERTVRPVEALAKTAGIEVEYADGWGPLGEKTTPLLDPKQNETEQAFRLAGTYRPA
ncbi:MAG: hypothetical protein QN183_06140 [Armatimonadota bacterium]|nr:hypothetical protein [Armatimonadota bacterium]MDR7531997.1 hypothetical protein [Armatimonadota bacterium]MDR7535928.1 hypothetical protein [Armatimonadota bacterium]